MESRFSIYFRLLSRKSKRHYHVYSCKGTLADNASIKCFHSNLKSETLNVKLERKSSKEIVSQTVIEYIEYYNKYRIQEKLGFLAPCEFRKQTLI